MTRNRLRQSIAGAAAAQYLPVWLLLFAALPVCAQRLSVRRYDVSDGLAHGHVKAIHQDRKGYIWFGTLEGLSRFDGYRFTNYSERDGLGHVIVNDIAEDRQGRLWVGTNGGGVARLIDDPREGPSSHQSASAPGVRRVYLQRRLRLLVEGDGAREAARSHSRGARRRRADVARNSAESGQAVSTDRPAGEVRRSSHAAGDAPA